MNKIKEENHGEHNSSTNTKKTGAIVAIIALIFILTAAFFGIWFLKTISENPGEEYSTTNIEEYGVFEGHMTGEAEGIWSGLFVFPKQIDTKAQDVTYYYSCQTAGLDNGYEIVLECTYDAAVYEEEVKRLSEITCEIGNGLSAEEKVVNAILYSTDKFQYPAYIAAYASHDMYEYALCNEETKTIVYVYMQLSDNKEILAEEYLPNEYKTKSLLEDNSWDNTNIYYHSFADGEYTNFKD